MTYFSSLKTRFNFRKHNLQIIFQMKYQWVFPNQQMIALWGSGRVMRETTQGGRRKESLWTWACFRPGEWCSTIVLEPMKDIYWGCWEHFNLSFQRREKCTGEKNHWWFLFKFFFNFFILRKRKHSILCLGVYCPQTPASGHLRGLYIWWES